MTSIPFTVYDIFAYLSSGSLLLLAIDYAYGSKIVLSEAPPLPLMVAFLFASYICGHIVASLSEPTLEELVTRRWIGIPSEILMGTEPRPLACRLFPTYCRALPDQTRRRVQAHARSRGFSGSGEPLFLHTFSVVCQSDTERKRLDEFRNLYGFSRNVAFSLVFGGLLLASTIFFSPDPAPPISIIITLASGLAMFARFLKFYRQYTYQLFITYAELPIKEPAKGRRK